MTRVPLRESQTADRPPWMTTEILQEVRLKRRLWAKHKRSPTTQNKEEYKKVERSLQYKIRRAKKNWEQELALDQNNPRKFYSYLRSKTGSRVGVGPLKVDGETVTGNEEMAEALNNYFGSVFQKEDETNIPSARVRTVKSKCRGVNFRPSIVKKMIKQLKTNSAPGPDGITPRLLQELVDEVAVPLGTIFTKSMEEGLVPEDWRIANVTPIFKKGQKSSPANYRPISLTSVVGKVMEKVIKITLTSHLKRNKLIRPSQHGFMQNKSCATNLLEYMEVVTKMIDQGESMDIIYLDFAKAFDLVPKQRLLAKLKAHGIDGNLLNWIAAWLTNRKQKVVLNGKSSSSTPVTSGVPQGSILGPVLFAIFINDIDEGVEDLVKVLLKFADDTKIGHTSNREEDRKVLQIALDKLCEWAHRWGMSFNIDKCHILHVGRSNPEQKYYMDGKELAKTEAEKDIGVLITSNMKPAKQCEKAARTANQILHQILRAFSYRDRTVLPNIYKQFVRPHIEFAVQAWSPWQAGDIEMLEAVQKKMVRQVSGLKGTTYEEKLTELGMDTLEQRRRDQDLIQTFKIIRGLDDVSVGTWFSLIPEDRERRTRAVEGGLNIRAEVSRLELRRNFFSQRVAEAWNQLPLSTKNAATLTEFKNLLRKK